MAMQPPLETKTTEVIPHEYDSANPDLGKSQHASQIGEVQSIDGTRKMSTRGLHELVNNSSQTIKYQSFYFSDQDNNVITYAATGINKRPYFANSYLVGYVPFVTKKAWVPLATLSMRKNYMLDHKLHGPGLEDIWQNSKQAYYHSHGDCEDHALILADWLIGLGYDARVVIGEVPQGGHAWVVLFLNGQEFVLESTSKTRPRSVNDFYLAALATDYRPKIQFNRDQLWVNTGTTYTSRYEGDHWVLRSRFNRVTPIAKSTRARTH